MNGPRRKSGETWRIWAAPLAIALATTGGLVSALVGDGIWDALSWLLLGGSIAFTGWRALRPHDVVPPAFRKP